MNRIVAREDGPFPYSTARALSQLKPHVVAFDTETTSLEWYDQQVQGVSICDGTTTVYVDLTTEEQTIALREFFAKTIVVIGHNITFDAKALRKLGIDIFDKEWLDTMVAEHLIDERSEKSLKKMAAKYLGVDTVTYEEAQKAGVHSQKFAEYAMNDAEWTWQIFQMQKHQLEACGVVPLMRDIEMPFLKALAEMEMNGILVDQALVEKKKKEITELLFRAEMGFYQQIGVKASIQMGLDGSMKAMSSFDINSTQHLRELLYDKYGLAPPSRTETGLPSTDKKALKSLEQAHPAVPLILEHRKYSKLLNSFLLPLKEYIDVDGRVRPHFNDCGTRTGRLSCTQPNLQQLPKPEEDPAETRACFKATPGYTMISCDYSGQEIRVLAHISRDPTLIEVLVKGQDLHLATANKFFNLGIPTEELVEDHPNCGKHKKKFKKERDQAKIINFGIAYGKGASGFSKDFNISEEEAQAILDEYFKGFPGVYNAIQQAKKDVRRDGYVTSMTGRRRHFEAKENNGDRYYANASFREAFNFLIQGYSADMIRIATVKVREVAKQHPEWDLRMLATVHDENVYEVKSEYTEVASNEIKSTFERAVSLAVPILSSIGKGANYAAAK